jgi:choline dehydrogenase-like flavoprotein
MDEHYDVIIIGSGAGGGTLAHRLASTGKKILILERGGICPTASRSSRRCITMSAAPPNCSELPCIA